MRDPPQCGRRRRQDGLPRSGEFRRCLRLCIASNKRDAAPSKSGAPALFLHVRSMEWSRSRRFS
jgi:hypothetical protein